MVKVLPPVQTIPQFTVALPTSILELGRYLAVVAGPGRVSFSLERATYLIPAGMPGAVFYTLEPNVVVCAIGPVEITADYYSPDITVYAATSWYQTAILPKIGTQLVRPIQIPGELFWGLTEQVEFQILNDSTEDVTINLDIPTFSVEKTLWEQVMMPLMKAGYDYVTEIAKRYLAQQGAVSI